MNKRFIILLLTLTAVFPLFSQTVKKTNTLEQTWIGYFNQTRITTKWGIWAELQYRRTDDFVGESLLGIIRPGITYYISDKVRLTAGYAFINHFPARGHENISQPEHRPWQQLQWVQKYKGFQTMQWLRLEQRYRRKILNDDELAEGYNFNYRARYNFALFVPFKGTEIKKKSLFLSLSDELMINFGKEILYNYFDQNRAFAGLGYQLDDHTNIQLGYLNVFQQTASGSTFNNTHAIRLVMFHNVDFRRSDSSSQ